MFDEWKGVHRWMAPAGCAMVLLMLALSGCNKAAPAKAEAAATAAIAIPVETALAARESITARYSGTATLESVGQADVVSKTTGILLELPVEEGLRVRKGQLLAVLDGDSARNRLAQASATLRKAQAAYDKADKGYALKITPKADYDSIRYDLETQRAIVAGAQLELSHTRVLAPIDGVIAKREVKLGNLVQSNQVLFRIVDMDPLQAVLNVPENNLGMLQAGQGVALEVDALPGKTFAGKVARIAPVVDAASGTFRATCEFSGSEALRPGMFGRIEVAYDQRRDALIVPRAAVSEEDGVSSVFVVVDGARRPAAAAAVPAEGAAIATAPGTTDAQAAPTPAQQVAERRVVKIGYADGDRIEIRDGLAAGDRVITVGRNAVRDGTVVKPIEILATGGEAAAPASVEQAR